MNNENFLRKIGHVMEKEGSENLTLTEYIKSKRDRRETTCNKSNVSV